MDNCIASESLFKNVIDCHSLHDGNNLSDHAMIVLTLNLNTRPEGSSNIPEYLNRVPGNKATENNTVNNKYALDELCAQINLALDSLYC